MVLRLRAHSIVGRLAPRGRVTRKFSCLRKTCRTAAVEKNVAEDLVHLIELGLKLLPASRSPFPSSGTKAAWMLGFWVRREDVCKNLLDCHGAHLLGWVGDRGSCELL